MVDCNTHGDNAVSSKHKKGTAQRTPLSFKPLTPDWAFWPGFMTTLFRATVCETDVVDDVANANGTNFMVLELIKLIKQKNKTMKSTHKKTLCFECAGSPLQDDSLELYYRSSGSFYYGYSRQRK